MSRRPTGRRPLVGVVLANSTGGIGAHVASVVPRIAARGLDVVLAAPTAVLADLDLVPGPGRAYEGGRVTAVEVEIATSPWAGAGWAGTGWAGAVRRGPVPQLRAQLAGADIVHAHGLRAGRAAAAARRRETALVVTWHNPPPTGGATGLAAGAALRRLVKVTDVTLGASADLVATARAAGARDARLCEVAAPIAGPPPTEEAVAAVRDELGLSGRPLVFTAGRLAAQKDHATLLAAAALLAAGRDRPPLVAVAGDGPDRESLAARIAADGLPVVLLGRRRNVDVLLAAADVAVLTSVWEARSLFAQEALRAGVPLVGTAVGGLPDLVGEAGLLVAAGSAQQVADAVSRVLDLPEVSSRLRAAGPAQAATWPGEDDTAAVVASVYDELLLLDS